MMMRWRKLWTKSNRKRRWRRGEGRNEKSSSYHALVGDLCWGWSAWGISDRYVAQESATVEHESTSTVDLTTWRWRISFQSSVLTSGLFSGRLWEPFQISCFTKIFNDYVSAGFFIKYMINIYYLIQINNGFQFSWKTRCCDIISSLITSAINIIKNASLNEQGERGRFQNTVEDLRINIKIRDWRFFVTRKSNSQEHRKEYIRAILL